MVTKNDNIQDIAAFIQQHPVVAIATADLQGNPDVSIVYCAVSMDNAFEFITLRETNKGHHLLENPRISLTAFDAKHTVAVKVSGVVEEMTDASQQTELFNKILVVSQMTSDSYLPPVTQMQAGEFVFYRLVAEHAVMTAYS